MIMQEHLQRAVGAATSEPATDVPDTSVDDGELIDDPWGMSAACEDDDDLDSPGWC